MKYDDIGKIPLAECDFANIPVNCHLYPPDEGETRWYWQADNFMPRKSYCTPEQYHITATSKEDILEAVKRFVVPLYAVALENLTNLGENYYWDKQTSYYK